MTTQPILDELRWRGLIHQSTDDNGLKNLLATGPQTVYIGFDPTAASLHIGSLMQLMLLRRFQQAGHRPIALIGGATGMIGDPSGKSEERNLLTAEQLDANVQGLSQQMRRFLDFQGPQSALLLNNYQWMKDFSYLDFLREVGKNFPVGGMLGKESVRARLASDSGLSYTEFSYMLLQAFDFVHLAQNHGCRIQAGGSDQWGNITAGIDLGRRMLGQPLFGVTAPLLLTSDGRKMGKTEQGTIWLDPQKTSPYAFYQYWVRVEDADVMRCLAFLTDISQADYQALSEEVQNNAGKRLAQTRLADWMTELVHGPDQLASVRRATEVLYGGEIDDLDDTTLSEIFADVPSAQFERSILDADGLWIVDAFRNAGLASSSSEARRAIQDGGAYVNNRRVSDVKYRLRSSDLASESIMVLRKGKRKYALLQFAKANDAASD